MRVAGVLVLGCGLVLGKNVFDGIRGGQRLERREAQSLQTPLQAGDSPLQEVQEALQADTTAQGAQGALQAGDSPLKEAQGALQADTTAQGAQEALQAGDSPLQEVQEALQAANAAQGAQGAQGELQGEHPQSGPTLLTSSLAVNKNISVFASYIRDDIDMATSFNSRTHQFVVFAPTNSAIELLPLKPWQFPAPVDGSDEKEMDRITSSNLLDFIASHVVSGEVPFESLQDRQRGVQLVSTNGKLIKLVNDNGDYYVNAAGSRDWVKVQSVAHADNGVILVIGHSLSVP